MAASQEQRYCERCRKTMGDINFYTYRNGEKCELCKSCLTAHVNNWDPETFLWILEKFDVPYVEAQWNKLRDRYYSKNPNKMTGMTVIGRYFSTMKINQWKNYHWADTEALKIKAEEEAKLRGYCPEEQIKQMTEAYNNGEISKAQLDTYAGLIEPEPSYETPYPTEPENVQQKNSPYPANDHPFEVVELVDVGADLTQEDKIYLAMKWGRLYSAADWVSLEQLYNDFMSTFDIQGASRKDTLKMICKTSLKMNQAIDSGDIESYQKLSRVYDTMMKSAKFTAAQNKEENGEFIDSVGELVALCEKEGFIPRFATDIPQDKVDRTLADMNQYVYKLVTKDLGFGDQIEQQLKKIQIQKEIEEAEDLALENDEPVTLNDIDYKEFLDSVAEEQEEDEKFISIQGEEFL